MQATAGVTLDVTGGPESKVLIMRTDFCFLICDENIYVSVLID